VVSDNATDKKIRLGEVASALNVAPKLVRNWTAREEFDLAGSPDREANKWREYSYLDVAHLAIAAQAIRYGFSISEAHDFAGATLVRILGPLIERKQSLANMPAGVIEALCGGKDLYLFRLSDGESTAIVTPMHELPRYHAAVHIDLAMCIGMAFAGLKEIGHDAFSSSRPKEYTPEEAEELERNYQEFLKANPDLEKATREPANVERQSAITAPGASAPGQTEEV
jgi:hypothetical protein